MITPQLTPQELEWNSWVGQKVSKHSGRPFKSGLKRNTVRSVRQHHAEFHLVFHFFEDNTFVACRQCRLDKDQS